MIDRAHPLGMSRQCALLALSRFSLYYYRRMCPGTVKVG
jgi:hypothetical protein